jgi:hypothetical protein
MTETAVSFFFMVIDQKIFSLMHLSIHVNGNHQKRLVNLSKISQEKASNQEKKEKAPLVMIYDEQSFIICIQQNNHDIATKQ